MDALKENKALVAVAVILALLVGASAYTNRDNDTDKTSSADETSKSENKSEDKKSDKETKKDNEKSESKGDKKSEDKKTEEPGKNAKDDNKDDSKDDEKDDKPAKASSFNYIAQPGDSYSVLARKAVQTYGIINGIKLSNAGTIAAESKLTQDAGSIAINAGQSVKFDQTKVKSAMDWAEKLSAADKAVWQTYVPYVEFDTRQNGE